MLILYSIYLYKRILLFIFLYYNNKNLKQLLIIYVIINLLMYITIINYSVKTKETNLPQKLHSTNNKEKNIIYI
jgi:hypothetical protein